MHTFTAIDFELATSDYTSVCAIGVVTVVEGKIVNEYYSLIQPPGNKYMWQTTRVHGIKAKDTQHAPNFGEIFPELLPLLFHQDMVAHNESFDRQVLRKTMELHKLDYKALLLPQKWVCTSELYKKMGFPKTKLSVCCSLMDIPLAHHDALSDARASALLYLNQHKAQEALKKLELD